MRLVPIPDQPGFFRDTVTEAVFDIESFRQAHVIWTFREGSKHPNVRVGMSKPNMKYPFILSSVSAPLVGGGEGYFHLLDAAAPLVGVQQFKLVRTVLLHDEASLREASLSIEPNGDVTVIGFGVMRS